MKKLIIAFAALIVSGAAYSRPMVLEIKGTVTVVNNQVGRLFDSVHPGDPVVMTVAIDTDFMALVTGDGATFLRYRDPASIGFHGLRTHYVIGGNVIDMEAHPFNSDSIDLLDSVPVFPSIPQSPLIDRFLLGNSSIAFDVTQTGASGNVRGVNYSLGADGASSLIRVPVTSLASSLHLEFARTPGNGTLFEGTFRHIDSGPGAGGIGLVGTLSFVFFDATSIVLKQCENRLRWLEQGRPWPSHGVHCEVDDDEDKNDDLGD